MSPRRRPTPLPPPPDPCRPTGDMTPWPVEYYRCADTTCPSVIHHTRAGTHLNDWIDVDDNGSHIRDDRPALLRDDPKAWWDKLAADMLAGDDRAGNLYAIMSMGGDISGRRWIHIHRAGDRINPRPDRDGPTCCQQPMWASPDGWACRVSRQVFPTPVGAAA